MSKQEWKMGQIFVAFSKYMNFTATTYNSRMDLGTDKRTDVWSRNILIWEINFGLWAVAWVGLWEKGVWADSEQLFLMVFSIFHGKKKN